MSVAESRKYKVYREEKLWLRYPLGAPGFDGKRPPKMREVARAVIFYTGIAMTDILSRRKHPAFIRARHIAMFLCVDLTKRSFPEIGMFFDRDHSTVIHAHRKISYALKYPEKGTDPALAEDIQTLRVMIKDMVNDRTGVSHD